MSNLSQLMPTCLWLMSFVVSTPRPVLRVQCLDGAGSVRGRRATVVCHGCLCLGQQAHRTGYATGASDPTAGRSC